MITPTYNALLTIYYVVLFTGSLALLFFLAVLIIHLLNLLAKKYKFLWMIVEYNFYRKEFKEFFKDQRSVTGRFNKK